MGVLAGFSQEAWLPLKKPRVNAPDTREETNCLELWLRVLEAGIRFCLVARAPARTLNLIDERNANKEMAGT
jgi:hypothetical protein